MVDFFRISLNLSCVLQKLSKSNDPVRKRMIVGGSGTFEIEAVKADMETGSFSNHKYFLV
jgi:hypothetical protein